MNCRLCANAEANRLFEPREMMLGTRGRFTYFQCAACECLQIAEFPPDMEKYYPATYYSLAQTPVELYRNPLKRVVKKWRDEYSLTERGIVGRQLNKKFPNAALHSLFHVHGLNRGSRILDVGCGSGALLYSLKENGFENVLGIDAYLQNDIVYPNGLNILKRELAHVSGEWDLVMLHHAFEHIADPLATLRRITKLLPSNGTCLLRVPTVSSFAWEHYGVNWVQLDAPRHFFLHSVKSMNLLAQQVGMEVDDVIYDSTAFQFWGSEQYAQDIPLTSERSFAINPAASLFSAEQITRFEAQAKQLNREQRGDSAAFYLVK
jgi:SAM-dependent methyltransferase